MDYLKKANKSIVTGILLTVFGIFGLGILIGGISANGFSVVLIIPCLGALLFLMGGILGVVDGIRRRSAFAEFRKNGTEHVGRIFSSYINNVSNERHLFVRYFDEDGTVKHAEIITDYSSKEDYPGETDVSFLELDGSTALLKNCGKYFSDEEARRLKYPRPVSEYSVKDITDIIASGDDTIAHIVEEMVSDPIDYYDNNSVAFEDRSIDREDEDGIMWIGMVELLLEHRYVCELDYKEEAEEFAASVKTLKGIERLGLTLDGIIFDPEESIPNWCDVLDRNWKNKACCMGFIDIDSDSYVLFPCTIPELYDLQSISFGMEHWITCCADPRYLDEYEDLRLKKTTLADDIPVAAEWAKYNLNKTGYKVEYDLDSMKEVERFFVEETNEGGALSGETGTILFSLGALIGETIIKTHGGEWITDDDDPQGEINIAVKLPNGAMIWPVQRCMKRLQNGPEDNIYSYVCVISDMYLEKTEEYTSEDNDKADILTK